MSVPAVTRTPVAIDNPKTATELAREEFLCRVEQIEGVSTEMRGSMVIVRVADRYGAEADRVYDIEAEVGRRYPDADLDVLVTRS